MKEIHSMNDMEYLYSGSAALDFSLLRVCRELM